MTLAAFLATRAERSCPKCGQSFVGELTLRPEHVSPVRAAPLPEHLVWRCARCGYSIERTPCADAQADSSALSP